MNTLNKDRTVIDLLNRLVLAMGKDAFDVLDYWEGYLTAIGVARPDNHEVLVYIDTFELPPDHYFVSLELPPELDDDFPYTPAGDFEVHSFEELVEVIQKHFASYS